MVAWHVAAGFLSLSFIYFIFIRCVHVVKLLLHGLCHKASRTAVERKPPPWTELVPL